MQALVAVLSVQGLTVLLLLTLYRRLSRKLKESEQRSKEYLDTVYAQFESLISLRSALGLTAPLPSTRGWAASPDFLVHLFLHAQREKPAVVVECSSGTSTVVLARALQLNGVGHVYSLEHDPVYAEATRSALSLHGLSLFASVIDAPLCVHHSGAASLTWYQTTSVPRGIEMLVVDGPPSTPHSLARYPALPLLFESMATNCTIFLDDANRPDEKQTIARWESEFGFLPRSGVRAEKGIAVLKRPDRREGSAT